VRPGNIPGRETRSAIGRVIAVPFGRAGVEQSVSAPAIKRVRP
jgi:hypothetical protein